MHNQTSQFIFPAQLSYVPSVMALVREIAKLVGFDETQIGQLVLATEEATVNAIKYGLEQNPDETITLYIQPSATGLTLAIREKGMPFDPSRVPAYDKEKISVDSSLSGLGIFLMKQTVDEVSFLNLGRDGKETRLTKYLPQKHIEHYFSSEHLAPFATDTTAESASKTETAPPSDLSWSVRWLQPDEAIEISKCAYRTYGYTYEDYIYYPERIIEMNQRKVLDSAVAVTDAGEIMGHLALKYNGTNDLVPELGVGFVKPAFRRLKIFEKLNAFQLDHARSQQLPGFFARAVASHPASQKAAEKYGMRCCGLQLGVFPSDVTYKGLCGKAKQKESGWILYRPINSRPARTVYLPPKHRALLARLFSQLDISIIELAAEQRGPLEKSPPKAASRITIKKIPVFNIAEVTIHDFGSQIVEELKSSLRSLTLEHIDAVYLFLNLENPQTAGLVPHFEELGFFLAGLLPYHHEGQHQLILQYLNNLAIDYNMLQAAHRGAPEIMEYIRSVQ